MKSFTLTAIVCLLSAFALRLQAQEGEPVFIEDFGSGTTQIGPQIGDKDFSTTYKYVPFQPFEGAYTIANSTAGMYTPSWLQTGDHTSGKNGYMMIVDATEKSDEFYKRTVKTLCPGTTYRFSVFLLNLMKADGIKPNITFSVTTSANTTVKNTGPVNTGLGWQEYSIDFSTPATGGDVVIKMTNNAAGGYGNDVALDDISLRPFGPVIDAYFNDDKTSSTVNGCAQAGQVYNLNAGLSSGTGYPNPAYQWQVNTGSGWQNMPGATVIPYPLKQPSDAGIYQYRVLSAQLGNIGSAQCRVASSPITLNIITPSPASATASSPVCLGENIYLTASAGESYSWTGPNGFTSNKQNPVIPNASDAMAGQYQVTIIKNGCETVSPAVSVAINKPVIASAGNDQTICKGESITLHATGGTTYRWFPATGLSNPNIANPEASPNATTTYTVNVTNNNCQAQSSVTLTVNNGPIAYASAVAEVIKGEKIRLQGKAEGTNVTYYWTPDDDISDSNTLTPIVSPTRDITYVLHVLQPGSCKFEATASVSLKVVEGFTIPNTFTPNGDGVNDTWKIDALNSYPNSTTQVFNRYGTLVFETRGYPTPWDGTYNGNRLPSGTYYYKIDLKNGKVYSGWVQIIG
ncbi:gliding motility-associated C-terminal domain-containing protein [Mucilaginibacter celer]|uniref:Ig-like domain-containing protein n=1 Tax=Mucilaginibacter celer TaxID=2305508 RepID=A0A494VVA3_9SPHI|nr:gliding motility-associated C-terminal domain-containing protein [Mucilaginibacter celer]AYL94922.1 hypothetical protein HYN43_006245 [Mucilaginibacter celer]